MLKFDVNGYRTNHFIGNKAYYNVRGRQKGENNTNRTRLVVNLPLPSSFFINT